MIHNRACFVDYKPITSTVYMGTDAKATITGIGSVILTITIHNNVTKVKLNDVLHISSFRFQILSVTKITTLGVSVSFDTNCCTIKKSNRIIGTSTRNGQLYYLDTQTTGQIPQLPRQSAHIESLQTWRERLENVDPVLSNRR